MDRNQIFQHFSNILDNMLQKSLFWDTFLQAPVEMNDAEGSINDTSFPENLHMRFGVSRACLIDDDYDYVIKFDMESDMYGDSLCQREVELYDKAKRQNLNNYFTEAVYLGVYRKTINFYPIAIIERYVDWIDYDPNIFDHDFMEKEEKFGPIESITINLPLYAYPRATTYCYTIFNDEDSSILEEEARSLSSPLRKRELQLAMEFIYLYGMEQYEKLTEFLFDQEINDLHRGNVGCLDGRFIIIDFAGYHYEEECTENF